MLKLNFQKEELYSLLTVAAVLAFGFSVNLCFGYLDWARASKNVEAAAVDFPLEINSADARTLTALPGVGAAMAEKIGEYREKNGGFRTRCEIRKVPGIGPRFYEKIKDKIYVACDPTPDADSPDELAEGGGAENAAKMDINRATVDNFKTVKGVGAAIGKKIVEYREKKGGKIENFSELSAVGGIGPKRMKLICGNFTISN